MNVTVKGQSWQLVIGEILALWFVIEIRRATALSLREMQDWYFILVTLYKSASAWWRHQMETFSALLAFCAGNSPVIGEFPAQRPVTRSFDVFFALRLNKRLSKQSLGWWFETPSRPLWRHSNGHIFIAAHLREYLCVAIKHLVVLIIYYIQNTHTPV